MNQVSFQASYDLSELDAAINSYNIEKILQSTTLFQALFLKHGALNEIRSSDKGKISFIEDNWVFNAIPNSLRSLISNLSRDLEILRRRLLYMSLRNDTILTIETGVISYLTDPEEKILFSDYINEILPLMLKNLSGNFTVIKTKQEHPEDIIFNKYYIHWYKGLHIELDPFTNVLKPYIEGLFTDFTFKIDERSVKCHRFVLYNHGGDVFQGVLTNNFKETYTNEFIIQNYSYETVKFFVDGLYYGPIYMYDNYNENNSNFFELLCFSDQYDIEWMKKLVLKLLIKKLSTLSSDEIEELQSTFPHWEHLNIILSVMNKENKNKSFFRKIITQEITANKIMDIEPLEKKIRVQYNPHPNTDTPRRYIPHCEGDSAMSFTKMYF